MTPPNLASATLARPDVYPEHLGSKDITTYAWLSASMAPRLMNAGKGLPILDAQAMVLWLKEQGLPVSAIAEALQVERKSVYSWLEGGRIKESNLARLEVVHRVLSHRPQASLRHLYRLFGRRLKDGATLRGMLSADDLDEAGLANALAVLWPLAARYEALEPWRAGALQGRHALGDGLPVAVLRDQD